MIADADALRDRLKQGLRERYAIAEEVARGGMAIVYLATDLKHDRNVAIKVMKPEIAASIGGSRFLREIRIAANLSHPHIVPVHESGECDGLLYYVMPFVEGKTLRERLRRGPRPSLDEVFRIAREVGGALSYAHERGVVHRDLKPENIMLAAGIAVVTDFGLARALHFAGADSLTPNGFTLGTPAYMSPEQVIGDSDVDGRSDIYSLGCIVYEMLSGRPPFSGKSALSVMAGQVAQPIPSLRDSRPDVPPGVERAITVALAKDAADRFATVDRFLDALETDRKHILPSALSGLARHNVGRVGIAAASVLLAVVIARGLGLISVPAWGGSGRAPVVAVLPFEHMGPPEERYFTEGMTEELTSRIAEVAGIRMISRASAMQFDLKQRTLKDVANGLKADFVLVGSIRTDRSPSGAGLILVRPRLVRVSDGREMWADTFNAALTPGELFQVQGQIAQNVAQAMQITLLPETLDALKLRPTTNLEAYNYYLRGNLHAAHFLVRSEQAKAIAMYERAVELDPEFALAFARLAQAHALFLVFDKTPDRGRKLETAFARAEALAPHAPQTRVARAYLYLLARGDVERAMAELVSARQQQPNNTTMLWAIGHARRLRGDHSGALDNFRAASALDPRSAMYLYEAATTLFLLRRYDESLEYIKRAVVLAPSWLPATPATAQIFMYQGKVEEARRAMLDPAVSISDLVPHLIGDALYRPLWEIVLPHTYHVALEHLSINSPQVDSFAYYFAKGRLFARRDQVDRRVAYFDSALVVLRLRLTSNVRRSINWQVDLGILYAELGRQAEARIYADSAALAKLYDRDALRGSFATLDLARLYVRLGEFDKATALLDTLLAVPSPATTAFLLIDPAFGRLHEHPSFRQLVSR